MALTRQCLLTVVRAGWLDASVCPYPRRAPDQEVWLAKRRRMNMEQDMLALSESESELWASRGNRFFGRPLWLDTVCGSQL